MNKIEPGLQGDATLVVADEHTAEHLQSGKLLVFSTPLMVALMEEAALKTVAPHLEPGQDTVGISLDIQHLAPTPVGMKVTAKAELVEVDRRRLVFNVEAFDEQEKIGQGNHQRMIIDVDRFLARVQEKAG